MKGWHFDPYVGQKFTRTEKQHLKIVHGYYWICHTGLQKSFPALPVWVSSPISQALWLGRRGTELRGDSQLPRSPRPMWLMKEFNREWEGFLRVVNDFKKKGILSVYYFQITAQPHQYSKIKVRADCYGIVLKIWFIPTLTKDKAMANQGLQSFMLTADKQPWHMQNNHLQPIPLRDIMLHILF